MKGIGLGSADLAMSAAKIVRAMRDHPQVSLGTWRRLPALLDTAVAGFPSARRDGSVVVVIVEPDTAGDPVVVPIQWDAGQRLNIILSVYGRSPTGRLTGREWIRTQLLAAARDNAAHFVGIGFADAEPKPEPAPTGDATSWSPGSIPADRPAKPSRPVLKLPFTVKDKPT